MFFSTWLVCTSFFWMPFYNSFAFQVNLITNHDQNKRQIYSILKSTDICETAMIDGNTDVICLKYEFS